ncbi:hypothetical protein ABZT17_02690 [Streptomyces sp. NPDC005648]|uniref:hypothetical protein n=1 Tax=Streptomyces sp. NPDC005648 TaxID=3157044 RepID=UPI0033BD71C1
MVSRLTRLLPPPRNGVEPQPWEEFRAAYGTAMPLDFQDFVDTYGYGSLDDVLSVFPPGKRGQEIPDPAMGALPSVAESEFRTFHGPVRFPPWPAPGALLAWGTTPVGYDLFWRRLGSDPDRWPVVVVGHRAGTALELPCTMVEFVIRMLGDPIDRPADITGIPGHPHSRYLNARDEAALDDAGEDPWEYLDDFWDAREDVRASSTSVTWVEGPGRHRADNPPVPRLTVQGFGPDGDELRVSATLDLDPDLALGAPATGTVRIGGPKGDVLRLTGVPVAVSGGAGDRFALDVRLPATVNDTGMTWHELVDAMTHEPEWRLSVSVADPAIGAVRARHGIVTGAGMQESEVNRAWGEWP